VQAEPFAPLHVRASGPGRNLRVVSDNDALAAPVAPVDNIITDLPLDPNFIDDSDSDEEELGQEEILPPSSDEAS
jgi:hypothetical protein